MTEIGYKRIASRMTSKERNEVHQKSDKTLIKKSKKKLELLRPTKTRGVAPTRTRFAFRKKKWHCRDALFHAERSVGLARSALRCVF